MSRGLFAAGLVFQALLLLAVSRAAAFPAPVTASVSGTGQAAEPAYGVAADTTTGAVYVTANIPNASSSWDIWVGKYNSSSILQSSITIQGPMHGMSEQYGNPVAVDGGGSVYLTGTVDSNVWVARYNSSLVLQSSVVFNATMDSFADKGYSVAVDGSGNAYVIGSAWVGGRSIIWLGKFNSALVFQSSATISGNAGSVDYGCGITVDAGGNVYAAGMVQQLTGGVNPWLGKYNSSLVLQASTTFTSPSGSDTQYGVTTMGGYVYAAGDGNGTLGAGDMWVSKYDASLVLQSSVTVNGAAGEYRARGITSDGAGNIYVTGGVFGSTMDIWTGKYNSSLVLQSSAAINGSLNGGDSGAGIAAAAGSVYVVGNVGDICGGMNLRLAIYNPSLAIQSSATFDSAGLSSTDEGWGVTVGPDGNIYAAGVLHQNCGGTNAWVGKYDSSLVQQSSVTLDGRSHTYDGAHAVASDGSGNIYVAGYVNEESPGVLNYNGLVAKYNSSLVFQASATFSGQPDADEQAWGVAAGPGGDVYVAGAAGGNIWVGRYSSSLVQQASATVNGSANSDDSGYGVAVTSNGAVYAVGSVDETSTGRNVWLAKYTSALVLESSVTFNGPAPGSGDYGSGVAVNAAGDVYVAGGVESSAGNWNIWLGKYDSFLVLKASAVFEGASADYDEGYSVAVDESGRVFVSGSVTEPSGGSNIWVAQFNSSLVLRSSATIDGAAHLDDIGTGIATDGSGGIYSSGYVMEAAGAGTNLNLARFVAEAPDSSGAPAGCGPAETRNVGKSGYDYSTIQSAVNSLSVNMSTAACVVIRDTQTYSEQVTVNGFTNNGYQLKIMADPGFVSSAPVVNPPVSSTAAFQLLNASVTVQGINIVSTNTVAYGIFASSASVDISSVNIISGGRIWSAGIAISSLSAVSFSSITVQAAHGLYITGSISAVSYSTVSAGASGRSALYLQGASQVTIGQSSLLGGSQAYGAYFDSSSYNTISGSTVTTSANPYKALYILDGSSNTVTQTYLANTNANGTAVHLISDLNTISRSTITTSGATGFYGLYLYGSSNTVSRSVISVPLGIPLQVMGSNNLFSQDVLSNNSSFSTAYFFATQSTITQSFISNSSSESALKISNGGGGNVISLSTITSGSNSDTGAVYMLETSSNSVFASYIANGSGSGIYLDGTGSNEFSTNTISGAQFGISIATPQAGAIISIASMTFSSLSPGAAAIYFDGGVLISTFSGVNFADANIAVNVNGGTLGAGSRITMRDSSGPRSGSAFEGDPQDLIDWSPDPHSAFIVWDGGGTGNNASEGANWVGDAAPQNGDSVRFDGTNAAKSCNWDLLGVSLSSFTMTVDFSTSVVMSSSFTVADRFTLAGGTFSWKFMPAPGAALSLGGNFEQTGGFVSGNSAGAFSYYGLVLNGSAPQTLRLAPGSSFPRVTVQNPTTVTALSDLRILDTLSIASGTLNLGAGFQHRVGYPDNINGADGYIAIGSATLEINSSTLTVGNGHGIGMVDVTGGVLSMAGGDGVININPDTGFAGGVTVLGGGRLVADSASDVIAHTGPGRNSFIQSLNFFSGGRPEIAGLTLDAVGLYFAQTHSTDVVNFSGVSFTNLPQAGVAGVDDVAIYAEGLNGDFTFPGVSFDASVSTNVYAYNMSAGVSTLTFVNAAGPRAGAVYENDPGGVVFWNDLPTGCTFLKTVRQAGGGDCDTIQACIDLVPAQLTGNWCVDIQDSAEYAELPVIQNKATNGFRLTVGPQDSANRPSIYTAGPFIDSVLKVANSSVTVQNLMVKKPIGFSGILVSSPNVLLDQVYVEFILEGPVPEQISGGISISSWTTITRSSISFSDCVAFASCAGLLITGERNTISYSTVAGTGGEVWAAVWLNDASSNTITRTSIYNPSGHGLATYSSGGPGSNYNTVSYSTITGTGAGYGGVYFSGISNTITESYLYNGDGAGVWMDSNFGPNLSNTISSSTIAAIGPAAFYVESVEAFTVAESFIVNEVGPAAAITNSSGTIFRSTITTNHDESSAVSLFSPNSVRVEESYIQGSSAFSVSGGVSDGVTIQESVLAATGGDGAGLSLLNSAYAVVSSVTIFGGPLLWSGDSAVSLSSVTFRGLQPGAAAIDLTANAVYVATFDGVNFADPGIAVNINGSLVDPGFTGSELTVLNAYGPRSGPGFENDPQSFISWPGALPEGCGTGFNVRQDGGANFTAIQAAVDALPKSLGSDTCVVIRDTQTYSEQVTVEGFANNGFRLKIMSDPAFVSSAPVVDPPVSSTAAFVIRNSSVTLAGLNVLGTTPMPYGVLASSSQVTLSSVNVNSGYCDAYGASCNIYKAAVSIAGWSSISNSSFSVTSSSTAALDVLEVNGSYNTISYSTASLRALYPRRALVVHAGASFNTFDHDYFVGRASVTSSGNTISSVTLPVGESYLFSGLYLVGGSSNSVSYSTAGFLSIDSGSSYNNVTDGYFYDSTGYIENNSVIGGDNNAVTRSVFSGVDVGVALLISGSSNTLTQSYVYGRGSQQGLSVVGGFNQIAQSTAASGTNLGLNLGGLANTVSEGYFSDTYLSGAYNSLDLSTVSVNRAEAPAMSIDGANHVVTRSFISNPSGDGLDLYQTSNTTVDRSTLIGGGTSADYSFALYIGASSSSTITNSLIQGSTAVYITGSTGTVIDSSVFIATSAAGYALRLAGGSLNLSLSSSTLTGGSQSAGIYLDAGNLGALTLSSNTVNGGKYGVRIAAQDAGAALSIASMIFSVLTAGATAINFDGGVLVSTFSGMNFADAGIAVNVNGGPLGAGSRITMRDSYGLRTGSAFERDPVGLVDWAPDLEPGVRVWDGGGAGNNASSAANWLYDLAPQSGDSVRFDGTNGSKYCNWDLGGVQLSSFTMATGFSTAVVVGAALSVSGDFTVQAGTLSYSGTPAIYVGGNWVQTGGYFNTGGAGAVTVVFNGGSAQTIATNQAGRNFGVLVASNTAGTVTAGSDLRAFSIRVATGTLDLGAGYQHAAGWGGMNNTLLVSTGAVLEVHSSTLTVDVSFGSPQTIYGTLSMNGGHGVLRFLHDVEGLEWGMLDFRGGSFLAGPDDIITTTDPAAKSVTIWISSSSAKAGSAALSGTLFKAAGLELWGMPPANLSLTGLRFTDLAGTGQPALSLGGLNGNYAFDSFDLDSTLETNVAAGAGTFSVSMTNAKGPRAGPGFETDPGGRVDWPGFLPEGCGTGYNVRQDGGANFTAIQAAVNALPAALSTTTCVVILDTTAYAEQVTVRGFTNNGYQLKIMADPSFVSSAPVVNPPAASTAAFQLANASVTLQGINIVSTNTVAYGILASSASVNISSVNVISGGNIWAAGIAVSSLSSVSYSSISVQVAHGLYVTGAGSAVSYSTMTNNDPAAYPLGLYALYLNNASSNTVTRVYAANLADYSYAGFIDSSFNTVSRSTISALVVSGHSNSIAQVSLGSLDFWGSSNTIGQSSMTIFISQSGASYNEIALSYLRQAYFIDGNYNTISQSTISINEPAAIALELDNASFNSFTQNYISNPSGPAVALGFSAAGNTLGRNTITGGAGGAALRINGVDNIVTQDNISSPDGTALSVDMLSDRTTISQSTITSGAAGLAALTISDASSCTVSNSYIQGSTAAYISYSTGAVISSSVLVATNTAGYALRFDGGNMNLSLSSSSFSGGPQGAGVYLAGNNSGVIALSSNTISGGQYGLIIAAQPAGTALSIASMTFSSLTAGATAINFLGGQFVSTFTAVAFNSANIAVNVNGGPLGAGSRITMSDHSGARSGSAFETDPGGYVDWTDLIAPAAVSLAAYQSGSPGLVRLAWAAPGDDEGTWSLAAGSAFLIQYSTEAPAGVAWSTQAAQVTISTSGMAPAAQVSTAITLGLNEVYYFRLWTVDEAGNWSAQSSTASAYNSPFSYETVYAAGNTGAYSSLAVDRNGDLHLASREDSVYGLKYFKRTGGAWSAPTVIDADLAILAGVSIALGPDGLPAIAYGDSNARSLKYAKFNGTSWTVSTVDNDLGLPGGGMVPRAGLVLDAAGHPHIAYNYENSNGASTVSSLKYAAFDGVSWSTASVETTTGLTQINQAALALDAAGRPHISYAFSGLKYASFNGVSWSTYSLDAGNNRGWDSSIVVDGNGNPRISYLNYTPGVTKFAEFNGTSWSTATIDNTYGYRTSLALDGDGKPHVSYYAPLGIYKDLRYARREGSSWLVSTVDSYGDVGNHTSLAISPDGDVHISYYDGVAENLKAAHWAGAGLPRPMAGNARGLAQAPADFRAAGIYVSSITWAWSDNSANELGFAVYGATSAVGPFSLVAGTQTVAAGATSFTETGLTPGATYFRYAAAVSAGGAALSSGTLAVTYLPVAAPVSTGSASGSGAITWSWTIAANALGYRVFSSSDSLLSGDLSAGTTYWVEGSLSTNTAYTRYVQAFNSASTAVSSTVTVVTPAAAPSAAAFAGLAYSSASLSWSEGANPGWTTYQYELSVSSSFAVPASSGSGTGGFAWLAGLAEGTTYYGRVRAVNLAGIPTAYSYTPGTGITLTYSLSAAPFSGVTASSLTVNWGANLPGGTLYHVSLSTAEGAAGISSGTTTGASFGFQGLDANTTYYGYISTAPGAGYLLTDRMATLARAPGAGSAGALSVSTVVVNWSANGNPDGTVYEAQLSTAADFSPALTEITILTSSTFTTLTPNTTYYARARALNSAGTPTAYTEFGASPTPPQAPVAQPPFGLSGTSFNINWDANGNPAGTIYEAGLSTASDFSGAVLSTFTAAYSRQFSGLTPNTTYYSRVRALGVSDTVYVPLLSTATLAMAPAAGAFAPLGISSVTLNWAANGNPGDTVYRAELSTSADYSAASATETVQVSAVYAGLPASTAYYARVKAVSRSGTHTSYTLLGTTATLSSTPGPQPVSGLSETALTLNWTANGNPAGMVYEAELSTGAGFSGALFSSSTLALSAGFSGLNPDTTYYGRVRGANGAAVSAYSQLGSTITYAAAPSGTVFLAVSSDGISLAWNAGGNPAWTNYQVWRDTAGSFAQPVLAAVSTPAYAVSGLSAAAGYYFKVRALNGAGVYTAFDSFVSTVTMPLLPGPVPAPSGSVMGTSSITWSWAAAASAESYNIYPATAQSSLLASTGAASYILTGLAPNTTYSIVAAGFNRSGEGPLSPASAVAATLANPPSGAALSAVYATSATLNWGLNGNPADTAARVLRVNTGTTFIPAGTSYTDTGLLGCTSYYFRVWNINRAGIAGEYAELGPAFTGSPAPPPPGNLAAEPLSAYRIGLTWEPAPFEGITGYKLYYDNGTGTIDYGTPLAVIPAGQTSYTTGMLTAAPFKFGLRAVHRCGVEETNTSVRAEATGLYSLTGVRAAIKAPQAGKRVNGNSVTVMAELVTGAVSETKNIRLQYKAASSGVWLDIPAKDPGAHPNPDPGSPYFIHWDVTALAPGSYDLRAVATDLGDVPDPSPSAVTLTVDAVEAEITENVSGGKATKEQKLNNLVASTLQAADPDSSQVTKVEIPAGALDGSTATVSVTNNPALVPPAPADAEAAGVATEITLSDQSLLAGGQTAVVTLLFQDADNNGILDGTNIQASHLEMYSAHSAAGPWLKDLSSTVDLAGKKVVGHTTHFSFFALFAPLAADLNSAKAYPVPWKPGSGGKFDSAPGTYGIIFDNLTDKTEIRIYTITGQLVRSLKVTAADLGFKVWDGKNSSGQKAASGVYLAHIKSGSKVKVLKIAVER